MTTTPTASVFIARHGQTRSNLERRYAGPSSEPLTETGRSEIAILAARLQAEGISEIRTSEIARAQESASMVGGVLGVRVVTDRRLDEMRLGPWEGLTEDEVAERYPETYRLWLTRPDLVQLDGRETLMTLSTRVMAAVADAAEAGNRVLLMTHVAPLRVAVLHALGLPLRLYKRVPVQNADCFALGRGKDALRRLGDGTAFREELERAAQAERAR